MTGIHHALIERKSDELAFHFSKYFDGIFKFNEMFLPYQFILDVPYANKPVFTFGTMISKEEKSITYQRMMYILPLIQKVIRNRLQQTVWHMADAGPDFHVTFCGGSSALLVPDTDFIRTTGYVDAKESVATLPRWVDRSPTPFWRGSTTGVREGTSLLDIPRIRLCRLGRTLGYDFAITDIVQAYGDEASIEKSGLLGDRVPWQHYSHNQYNIDIDGNSSSWSGLFLKLLCGGVVLKVDSPGKYRQWYYNRLVPWLNYVPIKSDMTDLAENVERLRSTPELAELIGTRGRELALSLIYETEMAAAEETIFRHAGIVERS